MRSSGSQLASSFYQACILVVDDEFSILESVVLALTQEGYRVLTATDGRQALAMIRAVPSRDILAIDLIVLDVMLPSMSGIDLCRLLRQEGNTTPILILSARTSETDIVVGLEVGADDYLTKPFGLRELIARCRALLRRQPQAPEQPMLQFEEIKLYLEEYRVTVRDREVNLSPKEFALLELFMNNPRRVFSREQLLEQIWGMSYLGDSKTVDVHIRWLREKLELDPANPQYIRTVRGFGYRFG